MPRAADKQEKTPRLRTFKTVVLRNASFAPILAPLLMLVSIIP